MIRKLFLQGKNTEFPGISFLAELYIVYIPKLCVHCTSMHKSSTMAVRRWREPGAPGMYRQQGQHVQKISPAPKTVARQVGLYQGHAFFKELTHLGTGPLFVFINPL